MAPRAPDPRTESTPAISVWSLALSIAAVLAAGLFAFWGTWNGQFLFDDHPAIDSNAALQAGDWWGAAFRTQHQPLASRPAATLSIALDFFLFGTGPFGPHLGNLVLHLGNGVLLLLILRRLLGERVASFAAQHANGLAVAIAALWVVHPLATDAVAYATQRSTLLGSACLLATLYCVLRAATGQRRRWQGLALLLMGCGMASKEDFVVTPLLVVLFVRAFLVPSWRALWAWRGFFAASAATWLVLVACLLLGPHNATVGFHTVPHVSALEWLSTQAGVVMHYLRLSVLPFPLRGAYDWDLVRQLSAALLPGLLVLLLLTLTVLAYRRHAWLGWLGSMFFLLLAPTSSVLPIVTEVVAERRAYLPMLAAIVLVVVVAARALRAVAPATVLTGIVLTGIVVAALAFGTRSQVAVYADEASFWADAFAKRTVGSRSHLAAQILSNHGLMLAQLGQPAAAAALFDEAMLCDGPTVEERLHHAVSLQERGSPAAALAALEQLAAANPENAEVLDALGTVLLIQASSGGSAKPDDARLLRAEGLLRRALESSPRRQSAWNSLGYALELRQQWQAAEAAYGRATELGRDQVQPFLGRARVLARLGRKSAIAPMFEPLLAARATDVALRVNLAQMMISGEELAFAKRLLREAIQLDPGQTAAAVTLRDLEARAR